MFDPYVIEDSSLNEEIARVYSHMKKFSAEDDEYQKAANQLSGLYKLRNDTAQLALQAQKDFAANQLESDKNAWSEEQDSRPFYKRVDPNTALTVAGNILIGLAVIKYEQTGVISTKVMNFMKKI